MEKITQRDYYNAIIDILNGKETTIAYTDIENFVKGRIELLNKKNNSRKTTLTETQKENLDYKKDILDFLTEKGTEMTTSNIAKEFALSTQRTAPILSKLVDEGAIVRTVVKRVTYYKIA